MLKSRSFVKKTKKGTVLKVVREHYLRDDVWTGWKNEKRVSCSDPFVIGVSPRRSTLCPFNHLLVPDTNVVLHQIDFLEFHGIAGVILLQTVLEEVKHRSLPVYKRIREQLDNQNRSFYVLSNEHHKDMYIERKSEESANDRNDRAIRIATDWCNGMLKNEEYKVVLLTNDNENREIATSSGLLAFTVRQYVEALPDYPELIDKLSQPKGELDEVDSGKVIYPDHLTVTKLHSGIKSGKLKEGTFQAKRRNYLEGHVVLRNSDQPVLVQGQMNVNRAIQDDVVAIEMLSEEEWSAPSNIIFGEDGLDSEAIEEAVEKIAVGRDQSRSRTVTKEPTAKVVGILRRNWRPYCGTLLPALTKQHIRRIFVPSEKRIPRIRITTRQGSALDGQRIVVSIDEWQRNSKYPQGHFVRNLGPIGNKETENEVLLLEHEIPHQSFSQSVLSDLPSLPWSVSTEELGKRLDLRDVVVCSVDPPGCTDIDDALHCRQLPNRNLEVGVHIADVSHFICPGSAIDKEAMHRGTTVYLVDKRIDMVPELLSSNLCSLKANEERLAMSCIWEMSRQGKIVGTKFCRSVIKSKAALTYEEAQLRIDDKSRRDEVTKSLRLLNKLAKRLRQKRLENGALVLASPEVRFDFDDESHDPIDLESKQLRETNHLVEEFMLLANVSVATKIYHDFPECAVLRRHQQPSTARFDSLLKAVKAKGVHLVVDNGKALAESLDAAQLPEEPYFNTLLRILSTRCMMQALYFCSGSEPDENFYHYGLAASIYTHFTSPIRRYPDIMVHRLLAVAIHADNTHPDMLIPRKIQELCNHLNHRHRMAQLAGRASIQLNTQIFFKDKIVCEEGYITTVQRNAVSVLIPRYGLEAPLFLGDGKEQSVFTFNEDVPSHTAGSVCLLVFSKVRVRLRVEKRELYQDKLKVELVEPHVEGFSIAVDEDASVANSAKRFKFS